MTTAPTPEDAARVRHDPFALPALWQRLAVVLGFAAAVILVLTAIAALPV